MVLIRGSAQLKSVCKPPHAILDDTALGFLAAMALAVATLTDTIKEMHHLLQVLFSIHRRTTMTALSRERCFGLHTSGLQQFVKQLT